MLQLLLQRPPQLILLGTNQLLEVHFQTCRTGLELVHLCAVTLRGATKLMETSLHFCWPSMIFPYLFIYLEGMFGEKGGEKMRRMCGGVPRSRSTSAWS